MGATASSIKAAFLYQSSRERMDAIAVEAEKRGIPPNAMLDRIVDDWFKGVFPAPYVEKKPWFME